MPGVMLTLDTSTPCSMFLNSQDIQQTVIPEGNSWWLVVKEKAFMSFMRLLLFSFSFFFLISMQRTKRQAERIYLETHNSYKAIPSQDCCCASSGDGQSLGWVTFCTILVLLTQQELSWILHVSLRLNAPWLQSKTCLINAWRMQPWSKQFTATAN